MQPQSSTAPTSVANPVAVSAAQLHVLEALKRRGEASADELAAAIDISASAVRQHLTALRAAGFVAARRTRGQPGRPTDRYRATALSEPLFARPDGAMSLQILEHVRAEDPELVDRVFDRRRDQLVEDAAQRVAGETIDHRVGIVTDLLEEQGYLADWEAVELGHYRINLHSCAVWSVANHFGQACTTELEYIRELLPEAAVERVTHKTAGAHTCAYDIRVS